MESSQLISYINQHGKLKQGHGIVPNTYTEGIINDWMIDDLVKVNEFICHTMADATKSILLCTAYWEPKSNATEEVKNVLSNLNERCKLEGNVIEVFIILDTGRWQHALFFERFELSKKMIKKMLGIDINHYTHLIINVKSCHRSLLGTLHTKFIVIDDENVILSSNNIQDRPNLEMAVTFKGQIVNDFVDLFWITWGRKFRKVHILQETSVCTDTALQLVHAHSRAFGALHPRFHCPQNIAWTWLFSSAEKSVFIVSPTLNASHALDCILKCLLRNVHVTIVLTLGFNDQKESLPFQGGTNLTVAQKLYSRAQRYEVENLLQLFWYVPIGNDLPKKGVHCHVKYMSIDGKIAMFGNGNMDTQSWYHSQEANMVVFSSTVCQQWDNALQSQMNFSADCKFPQCKENLPAEPGYEYFAY
jgi:phosphatidylserine/phosphatidylglycerophosphate/cardiolipin synthase-like enzyme